MAFAQIYEGCQCKDGTWQVTLIPMQNTETDECWDERMCDICGQAVTREKMQDGMPCMHALSDEEMRQVSGFYNPDPDFPEENDPTEHNDEYH